MKKFNIWKHIRSKTPLMQVEAESPEEALEKGRLKFGKKVLVSLKENSDFEICPDCENIIRLHNSINTDWYGNLKYYHCKNCKETYVSQNDGELETAAKR